MQRVKKTESEEGTGGREDGRTEREGDTKALSQRHRNTEPFGCHWHRSGVEDDQWEVSRRIDLLGRASNTCISSPLVLSPPPPEKTRGLTAIPCTRARADGEAEEGGGERGREGAEAQEQGRVAHGQGPQGSAAASA
eukprot:76938-Rhodomonas_salina.5